MAKLSRAKKQPVPPKDLSSLQGIVDEVKNRLSRAVAVVSVFTIYDMLFLCHSLQTLAWIPARCFGIGLKPKPRKKKNLLDWTKLKMQGSLPQEFDVISKFLIIDSVTYWGRIQPPP